MLQPILQLTDLGKEYRLYAKPQHRLFEILFGGRRHSRFSALSGVDLVLARGEAVGVIGDNGAGKSTLLKLIAGTITPSSGTIEKHGTVSALLELGAGFSPELTGRQNIYLNAALLGMRDEQIEQHEKEIIDFSELGNFIDQPVKNYSSGMYVRLGFSIAVSVEPELLIVDEALSVGDLHFQKKCIDRVMEKKAGGMSILFCSHSLYQVQEVCTRAVWLDNGRIAMQGTAGEVINAYKNHVDAMDAQQSGELQRQPPDQGRAGGLQQVEIVAVSALNDEGSIIDSFSIGQDITVSVEIVNKSGVDFIGHLALGLALPDSEPIVSTSSKLFRNEPINFSRSTVVRVKFRSVPLCSGAYIPRAILLDDSGLLAVGERSGNRIVCTDRRLEFGRVYAEAEWDIRSGAPE